MSNIYIHETHTIYAENNELHLVSDSHHIVINIDTFNARFTSYYKTM